MPTRIDLPIVTNGIRDQHCTMCARSAWITPKDVCIVPQNVQSDVLVVTKSPIGDRARTEILELLKAVHITDRVAFVSAIKCATEDDPSRTELKICQAYLDDEIAAIQPRWVLALGNEALQGTVGRSGIMKYRGHIFDRKDGRKVFATISPSMVYRNPGYRGGFQADLNFFGRNVNGDTKDEVLPHIEQIMSMPQFHALEQAMREASHVSFDVETNGFDEFKFDGLILTIAFTLENAKTGELSVWALPLAHPESPFRLIWKKVLRKISKLFDYIPKAIAHNGKFDCRWLRQFGSNRKLTFDTMLAAHLLDENRPKGLKPLAQQILGCQPWAINTGELSTTPLPEVCLYNGLDTFYTHGLYKHFRKELLAKPRLARILAKILVPVSEAYTVSERKGVWIDTCQLATNKKIAEDTLEDLHQSLMEYVPDRSEWPDGIKEVNFNASNFLRWFLFDYLQFPVLARGKPTESNPMGAPSVAESVIQKLARDNPHPVCQLLLQRVTWFKQYTGFLRPYTEMVDHNDRLHTTFKIVGAVTGRTASGKTEEDQVVTRTKPRGVNLQQVPRDPFIRGLFGAPPGSFFVEADYSQVELRVAAFLARERNMLHLYATGQDIHMAMAMRMTGKPAHLVTKEERKKAKAVNFGFLYGMGISKFIETAFNNYGVSVTEDESALSRKAFFDQFPDLLKWHARQRALAKKYGRVESPLGRIRHLPDIESPNQNIRAEAERQAINSPVQGFASDLALLSLISVMRTFEEMGLKSFAIGTVHDAINFEVPREELPIVLPIIKHTMENLPLDKLFGLHLDVPIIADLKVGSRWGSAKELDNDIVFNPDELEKWLNDSLVSV